MWHFEVPDLQCPGKFQTSPKFETIEELAEWVYRNWGVTFLGRKLQVAVETEDKPNTKASDRDGPDSCCSK